MPKQSILQITHKYITYIIWNKIPTMLLFNSNKNQKAQIPIEGNELFIHVAEVLGIVWFWIGIKT